MLKRYRKGQSTLEYVLLVTAVIVVIIGLVVNANSPLRTTVNTALGGAINAVGLKANTLISSF